MLASLAMTDNRLQIFNLRSAICNPAGAAHRRPPEGQAPEAFTFILGLECRVAQMSYLEYLSY